MAGFLEVIKIVVDTSADKASADIKSFSQNIAHAEGGVAKFKAGIGGAADFLKNNMALGLATVGTAAVVMGVKSVNAFQDLALAADKMATTTGLAVDEASRWIEVGGDVGITTEAMQSSFQKLAQNIGKNPEAFKELGITAKDSNGQIEQALELLRRTPEGAERAALGVKLFGKGWADMARLIDLSAGEVKNALEEVSEQKVIDPGEVKRAKELQATLDGLKDIAEDASLWLGQKLGGAFKDVAKFIKPIVDGVSGLQAKLDEFAKDQEKKGRETNFLEGITSKNTFEIAGGLIETIEEAWQNEKDANDAAKVSLDEMDSSVQSFGIHIHDAATGTNEYADAQEIANAEAAIAAQQLQDAADAANELFLAFQSLPDAIDDQTVAFEAAIIATAAYNAEPTAENLKDVEAKAKALAKADAELAKQTAIAAGASFGQVQALDATNLSLLKQATVLEGPAKQAILDRIAQLNGIPPEKLTEIRADIDAGRLQEADQALKNVSRAREAAIVAQASTGNAEADLIRLIRDRTVRIFASTIHSDLIGKRTAQGGVQRFAGGGVVMVGERGPELVGLPEGSQVMPAERLERIVRESVTANLNVSVGDKVSGAAFERAVISAVRKYTRGNGSLFS